MDIGKGLWLGGRFHPTKWGSVQCVRQEDAVFIDYINNKASIRLRYGKLNPLPGGVPARTTSDPICI